MPARLSAGACVALLPTRVLDIVSFSWANTNGARGVPGLRGILSALGAQVAPAALRAQALGADEAQKNAFYVAFELCHFQIELGGARWMAHGTRLNLTPIEHAEIATALGALFNTPDAQLVCHSDGALSLLCDATTPPVQGLFPDEALGLELKHALPTPLVWQRYLNEAQMLLAGLPLNLARAARGELTVNSVWFWGARAVETVNPELAVHYVGPDPILQALGLQVRAASARNTDAVNITDYRILLGHELQCAVTALPDATKMWLSDGFVYQANAQLGLLQRLFTWFGRGR